MSPEDDGPGKSESRYGRLLEKIFFDKYRKGSTEIAFKREDIVEAARNLAIELPKNLGDVLYSARYRAGLPQRVLGTQPPGKEWLIEGAGTSKYVFRLSGINRIVPNAALAVVKIPDATPEIIEAYRLSDEQALLARVRYNRLVDIFLSVSAYSLQNHLRTTVRGFGQIEVDEIYVGVDHAGVQYILPVQAKGGKDELSVVQTRQDIAFCVERYATLVCRALSAQFMANGVIALFELGIEDGRVVVRKEAHYKLVPASEIDAEELARYRSS